MDFQYKLDARGSRVVQLIFILQGMLYGMDPVLCQLCKGIDAQKLAFHWVRLQQETPIVHFSKGIRPDSFGFCFQLLLLSIFHAFHRLRSVLL